MLIEESSVCSVLCVSSPVEELEFWLNHGVFLHHHTDQFCPSAQSMKVNKFQVPVDYVFSVFLFYGNYSLDESTFRSTGCQAYLPFRSRRIVTCRRLVASSRLSVSPFQSIIRLFFCLLPLCRKPRSFLRTIKVFSIDEEDTKRSSDVQCQTRRKRYTTRCATDDEDEKILIS